MDFKHEPAATNGLAVETGSATATPSPATAPGPATGSEPATAPPGPVARPTPPPPPALPPRRRRYGCLLAAAGAGLAGLAVCALLLTGIYRVARLMPGTAPALGTSRETRVNEQVITPGKAGSRQKIAVIDVKGLIVSEGRFDAASTKRITAELKAAREDVDVVAVLLDMNTPGGEVTASDEIHRAVQRVRRAGKPVVTCMHAVGASGGYLIAAGTDYIVANRLTLTGSVGVIVGTLNYAGLFQKLGLESEIYKSGELKDLLHGGRARTTAERDLVNNLVRSHFEEFARIIAQGRPRFETMQDVLDADFADGRVLSGEQARAAGLIDETGYFEDALRQVRELARAPDAKVVHYRHPLRLTDLLFSMENRSRLGVRSLLPDELQLIRPGQLYYLLPGAIP